MVLLGFVSTRSKYDEKLKLANGKGDGEESEEPDYDEEQEEETGEITSATITTNQVFWLSLHQRYTVHQSWKDMMEFREERLIDKNEQLKHYD